MKKLIFDTIAQEICFANQLSAVVEFCDRNMHKYSKEYDILTSWITDERYTRDIILDYYKDSQSGKNSLEASIAAHICERYLEHYPDAFEEVETETETKTKIETKTKTEIEELIELVEFCKYEMTSIIATNCINGIIYETMENNPTDVSVEICTQLTTLLKNTRNVLITFRYVEECQRNSILGTAFVDKIWNNVVEALEEQSLNISILKNNEYTVAQRIKKFVEMLIFSELTIEEKYATNIVKSLISSYIDPYCDIDGFLDALRILISEAYPERNELYYEIINITKEV